MVVKEGAAPSNNTEVLLRGIWRDNPVLRQTLGLCSALAVTNAVANSLAMGLATTFVLVGSSLLVSSLRRVIPFQVRITTYIMIIATFVTVADMILEGLVPNIHKALGPYIALIVTNCIVLGRQEAFASKQPIGRALLDAVGSGAGFTLALLMMGIPRELLGSGSLLGIDIMGPSFEPWVIMILPPGGFLMIGCWLLVMNGWERRVAARRPSPRAKLLAELVERAPVRKGVPA